MRRGSRTQLVLLAVVAGVLAQLGAVAVNAMTSAPGRWPGGLDPIRRYPFWSALALTAAVVVIGAVTALRRQPGGDGPDAPALPAVGGEDSTMTRVDVRLNACAWVDGGAALAVGGVRGVYLFRFRRR